MGAKTLILLTHLTLYVIIILGFKNVVVVDPHNFNLLIASNQGVGVSPLVVTRVTESQATVLIQAKTSEGEKPIGIIVEKIGDYQITYTNAQRFDYFPAQLNTELYHIRFVWRFFHDGTPSWSVISPPQG